MLDLLAAILSGGASTGQISNRGTEYGVSQVFVAVYLQKLSNHSAIASSVHSIVQNLHQSVKDVGVSDVLYPGERMLRVRRQCLAEGIPVDRTIWEGVLALL